MLSDWTTHKNSLLRIWKWLNIHKIKYFTRIFFLLNSLSFLHIRATDNLWVFRRWDYNIWLCKWHKSDHIKNLYSNKLSQTEVSSQSVHCISKETWDKICIKQILIDLFYKMTKKSQWRSDKHCVLQQSRDFNENNNMSARHSSWLKAKMKETCATDNSERQYDI